MHDDLRKLVCVIGDKPLYNPFSDPTFKMHKCEVYKAKNYNVMGISVSHDDERRCLNISFDFDLSILGCYVVFLYNSGHFEVDDELVVWSSKKYVS